MVFNTCSPQSLRLRQEVEASLDHREMVCQKRKAKPQIERKGTSRALVSTGLAKKQQMAGVT